VVVAFSYVPAASGIVEEFNIWTNPNLTWEEKMQVNCKDIFAICCGCGTGAAPACPQKLYGSCCGSGYYHDHDLTYSLLNFVVLNFGFREKKIRF
jgi:hypothetical protein